MSTPEPPVGGPPHEPLAPPPPGGPPPADRSWIGPAPPAPSAVDPWAPAPPPPDAGPHAAGRAPVGAPQALTGPTRASRTLPPVPWRWWEGIVVFVLWVVAQVGVLAAIGDPGLANLDPVEEWTLNLVSGLVLALLVIGWVAAVHRRGPGVFLLRPRRPLGDLGAGVLAGLVTRIASIPIAIVVFNLVDAVSRRGIPEVEQLPQSLSGTALVLAILAVLVAAPLAEELFFRGFLFRAMRSRWRFGAAATVSAVLFGLVHFQPEGFLASLPLMVSVGAASVGFCWVYERRGSLLPAVVAHALFNSIAVVIIFNP